MFLSIMITINIYKSNLISLNKQLIVRNLQSKTTKSNINNIQNYNFNIKTKENRNINNVN